MGWSAAEPTPLGGWGTWSNHAKSYGTYYNVDFQIRTGRGHGTEYYLDMYITISAGEGGGYNPPNQLYFWPGPDAILKVHWAEGQPRHWYYVGYSAGGENVDPAVNESSSNPYASTAVMPTNIPPMMTYSVTYNGNGADGGSTAGQTHTSGVATTISANGFTRTGYRFTGWNTAADGTGTSYAPGATYNSDAALVLYAQWVRANIPVYVNVGGTVKQVEKAYVNAGGVVREAAVYANVGGTIKPLI